MSLSRRLIAVLLLLGTISSLVADEPRIAFVTSAKGTGDFSSWPEAGAALTGLEAADSICQAQAADAELANSGAFYAWLSDSNNEVFCRAHGLSGKQAQNCNGSLTVIDNQPVIEAGPWLRTDGLPAAAEILELLGNNKVYMPMLIDQYGAELQWFESIWSGTKIGGQADGMYQCSDWTSGEDGPAIQNQGSNFVASFNIWHGSSIGSCSRISHLLCVETGAGGAIELPELAGNIIFLTEAYGNGDLASWPDATPGTTGIAAGDSICNKLAADAGLPWQGSYEAWLSDSNIAAADRFKHDVSWQRLDGIEVAANLAELTDGVIPASVLVTDQGKYRMHQQVWTGTGPDGSADAKNCSDWVSTEGTGLYGVSVFTYERWTDFTSGSCGNAGLRLYCLSNVDPYSVFENGFEDP